MAQNKEMPYNKELFTEAFEMMTTLANFFTNYSSTNVNVVYVPRLSRQTESAFLNKILNTELDTRLHNLPKNPLAAFT